MKNSDKPAMPIGEQIDGMNMNPNCNGLTKREHFAAMAMQGLLSNSGGVIQANRMSGFSWCNTSAEGMAGLAVACADALLEELEND